MKKLLLSALLAASAFTAPAAAVVSFNVSTTYASGATFNGVVSFEDDFSKATAVNGTLNGYSEGSSNFDGGSSFINWVWSNGSNFAPSPSYGTFLMSGVQPAYASFVVFTVDLTNAPTLTFSSEGYGNAINYTDPLVSGSISAVPEAATWAMMIVGFGMVGSALRRRRYAHA